MNACGRNGFVLGTMLLVITLLLHAQTRPLSNAQPDEIAIRLDEDVFWIHVRDGGGNLHVLEKKQLVQVDRDLTGTLMPSYASVLTAGELDDLVAYLASRQEPTGK